MNRATLERLLALLRIEIVAVEGAQVELDPQSRHAPKRLDDVQHEDEISSTTGAFANVRG